MSTNKPVYLSITNEPYVYDYKAMKQNFKKMRLEILHACLTSSRIRYSIDTFDRYAQEQGYPPMEMGQKFFLAARIARHLEKRFDAGYHVYAKNE